MPGESAYDFGRSLSLVGVGIATDRGLAGFGQAALRGGARGNLLVGSTVAITDSVWRIHEFGWRRAFYQPEFYEETVGGIGGLGLGLAGGAMAMSFAAGTGPWAPAIGVAASVTAGTIGYFGGAAATHAVVEVVAPAVLRHQESQRIASAKAQMDRSISGLQMLK